MLIKNGTLVTPHQQIRADILVQDGKIAGIKYDDQADWSGEGGGDEFQVLDQTLGEEGPASIDDKTQFVDASGCYVFAGGIDPHVHLHLPTSNGYSSDDFVSGSRAALLGGTTSLIDFVTPQRGQHLMTALNQRKVEAVHSYLDYSFHVSPVEWRDGLPDEIRECIANGVSSFKVYMAYKDSIGIGDVVLEKVMFAVARAGGMLIVHAELGDEIDSLRNKLFADGISGPLAHSLSRPPEMESNAVKNLIVLAERTNCPVYIVHVSTQLAVDHIRKAQRRGQTVYAEVCPHHLLFDDAKYSADLASAAPYVMSPPLRKPQDQDALWDALADGTIQTVGTDHCPFMMEQKMMGRNDFRKIANGVGGIEHRLELLYTYGVLSQRITLERFVEVVSAQAAKLFGLHPHKGSLNPGSDADLVIWNPDYKKTISSKNHHQHCDHNIYEGMEVKGRAEYVITRGELVVVNGNLAGRPSGRFLSRQR